MERTSAIRHSSVGSVTALAGRPRGSDDGWLNDGVAYSSATWEATIGPSEVEWTGDGIRWTVGVAVDSATMASGVATIRARSEPGTRPDIDGLSPAGGIAMAAIARASHIGFGPPEGRRIDPLGLVWSCDRRGKDWRYYVRKMMEPVNQSGLAIEVIPRRNAPNYVGIAGEYLAAVASGEDPVSRIMLHLSCPSRATARKWIQRAAEHGLLTSAPPVPGARRGPGPLWPTD